MALHPPDEPLNMERLILILDLQPVFTGRQESVRAARTPRL
jgi:hypothetical protein